MRNLIELKFWAKFVSESEEKATQFIYESNIDLREVSERLRRLMPDDDETMPPQPPNSDGKRVDVRPSGDQEELTWKMASKLIHPSSHVIKEFENTRNDPPRKQFFALRSSCTAGYHYNLPRHCLDSLTFPAACGLSLPAIGGLVTADWLLAKIRHSGGSPRILPLAHIPSIPTSFPDGIPQHLRDSERGFVASIAEN
jgi:hypothetical protein